MKLKITGFIIFFLMIAGPIATLTILDDEVEGAFNAENNYIAGRGGDDNSSIINWTLANSLQYVDEWAKSFSFSSNGALLATGYGGGIVTVDDDSSNIWSVDYSSPDAWIADNVNSVMFSPDDNFLAVGHDAGLAVWNVSTWNEVVSYTNITNVYSLCFSPDGKQLATGGSDGNVRIWNTSTWDEVQNYSASPHRIASLAYSPNGSMLISGSTDFVGWNTSNWSAIFSIPGEASSGGTMIYSIEFSPQGDVFVTGERCVIRIWNTTNVTSVSRHEIDPLGDSCTGAYDVSFSSDGNHLAFGSYDSNQNSSLFGGQISILDTNSWSLSDNITPQRGIATALEFRPGDSLLASGGSEGEGYQLWVRDSDDDGIMDSADACSGTAQGFPADENGCSASQRDTDGDGLVDSLDQCPGTGDGIEVDEVGCWWGQFDTDGDSVQNSEDICPLSIVSPCDSPNNWILGSTIRPNDADDILEVLFSSEGNYLYTSSHNTHQFSRWVLSPNEGRDSLGVNNYDPRVTVHEYPLVYFDSPINSDEIVITCRYQTYNCPLSLHESNGDFIQNIAAGNMSEVQFSNDGRLLLAAEYQPDLIIRAYDTTTWEEIYLINSPLEDKSIMNIEFSPDDTIVAIAGGHSNVRLFNTTSWDLIGEFPIQNWQSFSFSPDGHYFSYVNGENNNELIIIDMNDGSEIIKTLNSYSNRAEISFSPDSTQIAILRANSGNTIYCRDCTPPAGHDFGGLQVYRLDTWQLVLEFDCPSREGAGGYACIEGGVFFSPVGDVLAVPTHHAGVSETGIMLFGADRDNDLIADFIDLCSSTQLNAAVDSNGCSPSQIDSDGDGVYDNWDQCAGTVDGATVDGIGCAASQIDTDGDGISNALDVCPNTSSGESVNVAGCAASQYDTDGDGVSDSNDDCPYTSTTNYWKYGAGIVEWDDSTMHLSDYVDARGCAMADVVDLDSDGDGVRDSVDECSNSEQGIITDENGCEVRTGSGTESVDYEMSDFCGALACFVFLIGAVLLVIKRMNSPSSNAIIIPQAQWKAKRQPVKVQHNTSVKGKIDHEQIRRLIHKYSSNDDVFKYYSHTSFPPAKESSVKNAIRQKRGENKQGRNAQQIVKDGMGAYATSKANMDGHPSLASQGSPGSSVQKTITPKKRSPAIDNRIGRVDTDLLGNNESIKPIQSKPSITSDSNGISVITTSFSVVTINKIEQTVVKVPTSGKHNQMFINEIKIMKSLDSKGINVGLLESEGGENPKIVTRYFGSHKLGDGIKSMNDKGKLNIISELIKRVGEIHGAGWIHRDLKPDNLLIDSRPRGDHLLEAIIDFGIAMKIHKKQSEIHNTAATKFFGHSSQKDVNFYASTGQDWFSLARIFALIMRGSSVDSLNAEIQMSQNGLNMRNEIKRIGFNDKVVDSMTELIIQSTNSKCEQPQTVKILEKIGIDIVKNL